MLDMIAAIPVVGPVVSYVVPFIFVLSVIIFVHELGHYVIGRWCGIGVEVFSVGFGPVVWSRRDRRGTVWQVAALPLGGYVRFLEASEAGSVREQPRMPAPTGQSWEFQGMVGGDRFDDASVLRRALTVAAGPVANFVLSVILFAGLAAVNGVSSGNMTVGAVLDLPGYEFGIQSGDRIIEVNGGNVADFADIQILISETATPDREDGSEDHAASASDATVRYLVERNGRLLEVEGRPPPGTVSLQYRATVSCESGPGCDPATWSWKSTPGPCAGFLICVKLYSGQGSPRWTCWSGAKASWSVSPSFQR